MKRHPIWIILFTILIDTLGIGILGPILPQLLGNPNSPHYLLGREAAIGSGIIIRSIPLLFLARALDGITGGNLSVAQASIADVTRPEDRTKNFGLIGAAFGVGFIVGPFLGGLLADPSVVSWFSASTPFWFAAMLAAANTTQVLLQFD